MLLLSPKPLKYLTGTDRQEDAQVHVLSQADALTKIKVITLIVATNLVADWNTSSLYESSNLGQTHEQTERPRHIYEVIS